MCAKSMRFISLIILFIALLFSHAEILFSQSEKILIPREATLIKRLNETKSDSDWSGQGQAVSAFSLIPDSVASGVKSDKTAPLQPHTDSELRLFTTLDFSLSPPLPAHITAKQVVPGRYASVYVDTSVSFERSLLEEALFIFEQQIFATNVTVLNGAAALNHPIALLFADIRAKEGVFLSGYALSRRAKQHADSDTTGDDHAIIIHTQFLKQGKVRAIASVLARELAHNEEQQKNSQYARNFQQPDAAATLTAEALVAVVAPEASETVKARYLEAFRQSDFEAMLAYYKMNYPREPYREDTTPVVKVTMPVLMFHGLKDWALSHTMLNRTWEWLEEDLTLVTVPDAGHWVHHDAADLVSKTMRFWLTRDEE